MTRWTCVACALVCALGCSEPAETRIVYLVAPQDGSAIDGEPLDATNSPETDSRPQPDSSIEDSPDKDSASSDASVDIALESPNDSPYDTPEADIEFEADAQEADAPEPVCDLGKVGDLCSEATSDFRECCPWLVCSQWRCLDPAAGQDGATACPCHCDFANCGNAQCICESGGDVQYIPGVSSNQDDAVAWCPPLWISYGPWGGCNTIWVDKWDGNRVGGSCQGHTVIHIMCSPCYAWEPCQ